MKRLMKIVKVDTSLNIHINVAQHNIIESLNDGYVITHACDSYVIMQKVLVEDEEYDKHMEKLRAEYNTLTNTHYE